MKNKPTRLLFLALLLSQIVNGQIVFQKNYGLDTIGDYGNSVIQSSDEGYYIAGGKVTSNGNSFTGEAIIKRTDKYGNELWTINYSTFGSIDLEFKSIEKTSDNNLIVTGSVVYPFSGNYTNVYLSKIDTLGNVIWSKNYGGLYRQSAYQVKETTDGGFVIGGFNEVNGGAISSFNIIKTNSLGDTIWTKNYPNGMQQYGKSITQTSDNGYAIAGSITIPTASGEYFYVIKTNSTGDTIWTKIITDFGNGSASEIISKSNGNILLSGYSTLNGCSQPILIKLNSNGDILWSKIYTDGPCGWAMSICSTNDNGYALLGLDANYKCYLIKTDSAGNQEWYNKFSEKTFNYGYNIKQTSDLGYIMIGITSDNNVSNILLIKTNNAGTVLGTENIINEKSKFSAYPNPTNGIITINMSEKNVGFRIFNSIGQLLFTKDSNKSIETFDLSNYSNGFYYIKSGNQTTKIIKHWQ